MKLWMSVVILAFAVARASEEYSDSSSSEESPDICKERSAMDVAMVISIYESKCLEKENIDIKDVLQYKDYVQLAEEDRQFKCFSACYLEFNGVLSNCELMYEKDQPDTEVVDMPHILQDLKECRNAVNSTDRCECAYEMIKCIDDLD